MQTSETEFREVQGVVVVRAYFWIKMPDQHALTVKITGVCSEIVDRAFEADGLKGGL